MQFDAKKIRTTRKTMQWSVVPMATLAALTLGHTLLPLLLCLLSLAMLLCVVCTGLVEEQVVERGSPWLWRKADAMPRQEEWSVAVPAKEGRYREQSVEAEPARLIRRRVHWFTWIVEMMPVWMGGGGLGLRLVWRRMARSFNAWDTTPSDAGDRFVQSIVDELRRRERLDYVRSTHVDCPGRICAHCKDIVSKMGGV